jgi:hypothetical protein
MMARRQQGGDSGDSLKEMLVELGKTFVLPFVIFYALAGTFVVWFVAKAFPHAVPVIAGIIVVIGVAVIAGTIYLMYKWRRFQHWLIARRADKQNTAYLRGDDERGVHGKFRPEDL